MNETVPIKDVCEVLREYMIRPKGNFIWRDVPGYEGRYQISNHGEVCSIWDKHISDNDTQVVLISIDKSRKSISRNKLLKKYWKEGDWYNGDERWKKLEYFGEYYVSNYANVKNCRRLVLIPTDGRVTLEAYGDKKRIVTSVLSIFLTAFPPYELEINHDKKEINWKKNENNANTSKQKSA